MTRRRDPYALRHAAWAAIVTVLITCLANWRQTPTPRAPLRNIPTVEASPSPALTEPNAPKPRIEDPWRALMAKIERNAASPAAAPFRRAYDLRAIVDAWERQLTAEVIGLIVAETVPRVAQDDVTVRETSLEVRAIPEIHVRIETLLDQLAARRISEELERWLPPYDVSVAGGADFNRRWQEALQQIASTRSMGADIVEFPDNWESIELGPSGYDPPDDR